jgi:glutamate N-acetyltransferase/amino-acid N-acetyltransferase
MEDKMRLIDGGITAVPGIQAAGMRCGIKEKKRDLALIYSERPSQVAAMFTTNEVQAAPIRLCKQRLSSGKIQAVIVNSGNANACTGQQGMSDAERMARLTAQGLGIDSRLVWVASTGIIGVPLPLLKIEAGIKQIIPRLSPGGGHEAAEAILTTDTHPKQLAVQQPVGDRLITIGAMAKGSGMIRPQLATMLCFMATDAAIESTALQSALEQAVNKSFNLISVDGDTSTNDMVLLLANGRAGGEPLEPNDPGWPAFCRALDYVALELAKAIVKDGEGATKLVEIRVQGATCREQARRIAFAIADSPLVKTALFGQQPNWGRIMAAAGKLGAGIQPERIDIYVGNTELVAGGRSLGEEAEAKAKDKLKDKDVRLTLNLNLGNACAQVWTTDLSYDYVRINAEYHS